MQPARPRLRIALAAVPPMLADGLRTLLDGLGEVTLIIDPTRERFDVAVITAGGPRVDADLVIELAADHDSRGGGRAVDAATGTEWPLHDLEEVLALLRRA